MEALGVYYQRLRTKQRSQQRPEDGATPALAGAAGEMMPKQRAHPHHHSLRERRRRQQGLQLPDPIMPSRTSSRFEPPSVPRIVPSGWRFRSAPFMGANGAITLTFAALALLTFACVAGAVLLNAIVR
jgi:hypothetical protein